MARGKVTERGLWGEESRERNLGNVRNLKRPIWGDQSGERIMLST